ncbi:chemotaxis protein CheW [Pseudanabaena mucicola]|uniref:Chemotaxis protein CheW n=1 Tax=Pseudanabaena mucicola FACHB-723 TaxID=2692860 RepID=A0ABR7ZZC1_9CYAN|nr:chemotaxis protein CheW [Pseudanabaena mucicola]MBD2189356.1 chemotaxis protein CheW [Pseudanabaena mucicola FACHB-723]
MSMQTFLGNADQSQGETQDQSQDGWDQEIITCLKFAINSQTIGLLESEFTQEVLTVKADHVMPVPNKPSCILGIISRRRRVYWAVDLAMLLGLKPLASQLELYEVILTSCQDLSIALIVPSILGVVKISANRVDRNIISLQSTLRPYLKGYINEGEDVLYLLKAENILRSTLLHS